MEAGDIINEAEHAHVGSDDNILWHDIEDDPKGRWPGGENIFSFSEEYGIGEDGEYDEEGEDNEDGTEFGGPLG